MAKRTIRQQAVPVSSEVADMLEIVTEQRGATLDAESTANLHQIRATRMVESGGWEDLWKWYNRETERLRKQYFNVKPESNPENDKKREEIRAEIYHRQLVQETINTYVQNSLNRRKQ